VRFALVAACVPLLAWVAALWTGLEPAQWASLSPSLVRAFLSDALLFTAAGAIVLAPILGVAVVPDAPSPRFIAALTVPVLAFVASSASLAWLGSGGDIGFVATSHVSIASVTLALAGVGALCGATFRDPLDASACSLTVALTAALGVLAAGAWIADIPRGVTDAAMLGSPLVAMASAAHIDLVRMDLLYQISPLARLGFAYPEWPAVSALYLGAAGTCLAATVWIAAGRRVTLPADRTLRISHAS
jgi:hypothetical protein